jgi:N-acetylmuramoyl-L-alanine amidase
MNKLATQLTLIVLLLAAYAQAVCAGSVPVQSVAYQKAGGAERVVIAVSGDISWKSAVLGKSSESGNYRLYVDISGTQPSRNARKPDQPASSLIQQIRVAPRDTETTRVVLELTAPLDQKAYSVSRSPDSTALVIDISRAAGIAPQTPVKAIAPAVATHTTKGRKKPDLLPSGLSTNRQAAAPPHPPAAEAAAPGEPADESAPCVIVIDPGHGGKDPGATGYGGVEEKNISLAIARELKKILDADSRCRVLMTRTTDTFVSLEDRAALANSNRANLFISIHTNAHEDSRQKGTETYYLDFSSDTDARRVAARENFTTPEAIGDLELILFDLLQSDKINQSSILAGHVHNALMSSLKSKYPDIRNLGIKHAPLKVLVDAEMPCLILETAFLSNPVEASRLQTPAHQRLLAQAITDGIGSFLRGTRSAAHQRASLAEM